MPVTYQTVLYMLGFGEQLKYTSILSPRSLPSRSNFCVYIVALPVELVGQYADAVNCEHLWVQELYKTWFYILSYQPCGTEQVAQAFCALTFFFCF